MAFAVPALTLVESAGTFRASVTFDLYFSAGVVLSADVAGGVSQIARLAALAGCRVASVARVTDAHWNLTVDGCTGYGRCYFCWFHGMNSAAGGFRLAGSAVWLWNSPSRTAFRALTPRTACRALR